MKLRAAPGGREKWNRDLPFGQVFGWTQRGFTGRWLMVGDNMPFNGADETARSVTSCPDKRSLRREKIALRKALSPAFRRAADAAIHQRLRPFTGNPAFSVLVAYVSDGTEPDLLPVMREFLQRGGVLCLPRFRDAEHYEMVFSENLTLVEGKWGIPEPGPEAEPAPAGLLKQALWLVPGVAFDDRCRRLGRGKGVYDRLLADGAALVAGVFYDCQKCGRVPCGEYDRPLDLVVTESGICRRKPE